MLLAAAGFVLVFVIAIAWLSNQITVEVCECPYLCPHHPTEGTAE